MIKNILYLISIYLNTIFLLFKYIDKYARVSPLEIEMTKFEILNVSRA